MHKRIESFFAVPAAHRFLVIVDSKSDIVPELASFRHAVLHRDKFHIINRTRTSALKRPVNVTERARVRGSL